MKLVLYIFYIEYKIKFFFSHIETLIKAYKLQVYIY